MVCCPSLAVGGPPRSERRRCATGTGTVQGYLDPSSFVPAAGGAVDWLPDACACRCQSSNRCCIAARPMVHRRRGARRAPPAAPEDGAHQNRKRRRRRAEEEDAERKKKRRRSCTTIVS